MKMISLFQHASAVLFAILTFLGAAQPAMAHSREAKDKATTPLLLNPAALKWEKTIPEAGGRSPEYAILHSDPISKLTMIMFRTPVAVHIKPHTHDLAETHVSGWVVNWLKGGPSIEDLDQYPPVKAIKQQR